MVNFQKEEFLGINEIFNTAIQIFESLKYRQRGANHFSVLLINILNIFE